MRHLFSTLLWASAWQACLATVFDGPNVQLGGVNYTPQYNETGDYYIYSNVRYAAPPVGNLRWSKPQAPQSSDPVFHPNDTITCTQVTPNYWNLTGFPGGHVEGQEDCLFLDIYVPRNQISFGRTSVMLWIHGGGFITGSKSNSGSPAGLLYAADEPVIYVRINYRLGALGFLDGHEIRTQGTANAGLHDQRAALDWVYEHISQFGGNPSDITVFGESAGASSISYQLVAYGGQKCPPFRRAVLQSNGFFFGRGHSYSEERFKTFTERAGCSDLECLRNASSDVILETNTGLLINSTENYGPQIDGDFLPDFPGWLLQTGHFCQGVELMMGNNDDEGGWRLNAPQTHAVAYTNDTSEMILKESFSSLYPLTADAMDKFLGLYPVPSENTSYTDMIGREQLLQSELNFLSMTQAIANAWKNQVYTYKFSVGYTIHADDVPYTYYNGPTKEVKNATQAIALQKYITRFATTGDPNGKIHHEESLPKFQRMDHRSHDPVFVIGDGSMGYTGTGYFNNERASFIASGEWM